MDNIWIVIITPIATVICNAIYILIVKKDLDRRLEQYKITYSGIFKEKLEHYKQLLKTMDELKDMVIKYGNKGQTDDPNPVEIMKEINNFIRFNEYGSIYYTKKIEDIVEKVTKEFQDVFETSVRKLFLEKHDITRDELNEHITKLSSLVNGATYYSLKKELIENIKDDFDLNK